MNEMNKDEREGLPSASSGERLIRCLGSSNAINALKKGHSGHGIMGASKSTDADIGTKRHKMIETGDTDFQSVNEEYVVKRSQELLADALRSTICQEINNQSELEQFSEQRLWLLNQKDKKLISGKFDVGYICKEKRLGFIADYKTLYGDHGTAWDNWQIRIYAVILSVIHDLDKVYVCLIQPNLAPDKQLTKCVYEKEHLEQSKAILIEALEGHKKKNAKRTPGKWCDWCDARFTCAECISNTFLTLSSSTGLEHVTPDLLDQINLAFKLIKEMREKATKRAVQMLESDPSSIPGKRIKIGSNKTKKTDVWAASEILNGKINSGDFANACSLSVDKLIGPYQEKNGIDSPEQAKKELEELLSSVVTKGRDRNSITNA